MAVLLTGAAGFIGYHVAERLLAAGREVIGIDNVNDYYSVPLKETRLARLSTKKGFTFVRGDIAVRKDLEAAMGRGQVDRVINLAAQAGVRHSISAPEAYIHSNLIGFAEILEVCRHAKVQHLVYASSSSVYGLNATLPFATNQHTDHPLSLYAATKKANEMMAHSYSHLYALPTTGLRFFTVYGPWGRPDMALFRFTRALIEGTELELYNSGAMERDFTYIDDIVEGIVRILEQPAAPSPEFDAKKPDPSRSSAPYRIFNIGNHTPINLRRVIALLEEAVGVRARVSLAPMQPGDVTATCADVDDLAKAVSFAPRTRMEDGIPRFVQWYREYHGA